VEGEKSSSAHLQLSSLLPSLPSQQQSTSIFPSTKLITFAMANIEQTWSLAGKVAVVTGSGKMQQTYQKAAFMLTTTF
jgi:uridylate kinase